MSLHSLLQTTFETGNLINNNYTEIGKMSYFNKNTDIYILWWQLILDFLYMLLYLVLIMLAINNCMHSVLRKIGESNIHVNMAHLRVFYTIK
jgi:hypothetical protein